MENKHGSFDVRIILYPISFLLLYQFLGSVLSSLITNFTTLISVSTALSVLLCFALLKNKVGKIWITANQLLLSIFFIGAATCLFILRINWGIFDFICPTGILGITHQIASGKFPASYPSFPEVTMNYHQGFLFISGTSSYVFGVEPALALKMAFIFSFILIATSLLCLFLFHKSKFYLLPLILFVLISSISPQYFIDLGQYNYINVFEYVISNSWPLGLLGVILILFFISINSQKSIFSPCIMLFVLTLSTVNATVYSLLMITMGLLIVWRIIFFTTKKHIIESTLYFFCLCIIYFIPKYLPSAFLIGQNYELVQAKLKWAELAFASYINSTAQYFLLINPITFLGLYISLKNLKENVHQLEIFLSFFLIVTFFFPMIIFIPNISTWDNIHKFAILDIFLSILLVGFQLKSGNKYQKAIVAGTIFGVLCSIPADIDLFLNRTSSHFIHLIKPNNYIKDVVNYLNQVKEKKIMLGFKSDFDQKCNESGFSSIAQYAGLNFVNGYFPEVFLLEPKLEKRYSGSINWELSSPSFINTLNSLNSGDFIIMKNQDRTNFITKLQLSNIQFLPTQLVEFNHFSLFKTMK